MKRLPEAQYRLLEDLSRLEGQSDSGTYNVLVRDGTVNRWYLYRYVEHDGRGISAVRSCEVEALINKGYLERVMMDTAGAFDVYGLTGAGKTAWANESLRRQHKEQG